MGVAGRAGRLFRSSGIMVEEPLPLGKCLNLAVLRGMAVARDRKVGFVPSKKRVQGSLAFGHLTWIANKLQLSMWADVEKELNNCKGRVSSTDGLEQKPVSRSLLGGLSSFHEKSSQNLEAEFGQRPLKQTLDWLEQPGIHADSATYAFILRRCGSAKALVEGKRVHAHIIRSGYERDRFLGNLLIQMYGNCGALEDARAVFDEIHRRNVFSWTIMIGAYVQHGDGKEALHLFQQMQLEGVIPDRVTFVSILSACANQLSLAEGKQVHASIVGRGFESDVIVGNALINMYGKCGSVDDARRMFDKMPKQDVVSWTAIIAAYAEHGQGKEALQLFEQMQLEGVMPNRVTFLSILEACSREASLDEGKRLHACIVGSGYESDVVVGNTLINMYGKCGSLQDARRMFEEISERDVVSWNAMIAAYVQHGQDKEALQLFQQMQLEGMIPDKVTFVRVLSACANHSALVEGKQIHVHIMGSRLESDVLVGNALVSMYGKCGSLEDARKVFDKMHERNVVSWNAMIAAYAQNGHSNEALQLFHQMQLMGVIPDRLTFVSILDACASKAALTEGKQMHARIVAGGLESDVIVGNALITMYGKCNCLEDARRVFEKMPGRNMVSWNAMIAAYAQQGQGKEAFQLFQEMQLKGVTPDKLTFISGLSACASQAALAEGKHIHASITGSVFESDVGVGNALINMYGKCGSLEDARRIFDKMPEQDVVSWNAIIAAYAQHELGKEALRLFQQMKLKGVIPDRYTFVNIASACATQAALAEGKRMHTCIEGTAIESDVVVGNALVTMYGKCGCLEDAWRMFDKMPERNAVSWTSMIAAYAQHGQGKEALQLFQQMQLEGMIPDKITFVSVLSACSHTGMVDQGNYEFVSMNQDHNITPTVEHYNCMIGLLGRTGQLDEGEDLINNMPLQPTAMSWMTLLGACRVHHDADRGKRAADHVFKLDPQNATTYVLLANIYAAAGRWNDASKVRKNMERKGLKKQPSRSLIELMNRVYAF